MPVNAEWAQPSDRPEGIDILVKGTDRYNPSNVGFLKEYLYLQMTHRKYDAMANLAILKLYQFNPEMMETTTVLHILLKALVHADGPDFELCLSLLEGPNIALLSNFLEPLTELSSLLQACQYPKFWRAVKALPRDDDEDAELGVSEAIDEHIGFADQVRMLVLESVASTFSDIPTKRLASYLDLTEDDTRSYVSAQGWTVEGETIRIPASAENPEDKSIGSAESIKLPQLARYVLQAGL